MTTRDALAPLRGYRDRAEHLLVGLMTGTSADAIDAALVRFRGAGLSASHELIAYRETPLDPALREEILEMAAGSAWEPERLLRLDADLGERYASSTLELLEAARVSAASVDAVGLHGQTVRHVPRREGKGRALTLQAGSPAVVAERTGIPVVSGFRYRDAAAGGEGAPLVPVADWWLFRSREETRLLLNLGGMANVTYLPRGGSLEDVVAFDTGPGNAVLDGLARLASGGKLLRDDEGAQASRGRPDQPLLEELFSDPFFSQPPPRSTGREHFGESYAQRLHRRGEERGLAPEDLMATAVELTAAAVGEAMKRFMGPPAVDAVYASGGGVRNRALMSALARLVAPARLETAEALGVDAGAKEALAFAFLAHLTLSGETGNVPRATGAARAAVLGNITPGAA